jgi:hypothetical protein
LYLALVSCFFSDDGPATAYSVRVPACRGHVPCIAFFAAPACPDQPALIVFPSHSLHCYIATSCDKNLGVASIGVAAVLGLVAFDVSYFKSIYFLRIDLSGAAASTLAANQTTPFVDLGVLGYCTDLQNRLGPQCSPAKIGSGAYFRHSAYPYLRADTLFISTETSKYINGSLPSILSNSANVATAALTKALVLHITALVIALIAFAFALLALLGIPFITECCADCFSGFAGATGLTVFIFDLAFFFIKKRVNAETGAASAVMGNAIWLTVIAMLLLFVTPILFLIGKCCGCAGKPVGRGIYKPLK